MNVGPVDPDEVPTLVGPAQKGFSATGPEGDPDGSKNDDKHSALVGFMSQPVHPRLPVRRSTLVMVVLFLGFGTLWYLYPPDSSAATSGSNPNPNATACIIPGLCRGGTTATTTTTTTTPPPAPTTSSSSSTTTTRGSIGSTTTSTTLQAPGTGTGSTTTSTTLQAPGTGTGSTTTSTVP